MKTTVQGGFPGLGTSIILRNRAAISGCTRQNAWEIHAEGSRHVSELFQPRGVMGERGMEMPTILVIILIVLLVGGGGYGLNAGWGYGPTGGIGLIVLILIVLLVMGRI
jgi:hypothetical protein